MDQGALEFYATPGRFATLDDGEFSSGDIRRVVDVVQGLLVYDLVAQSFYGVELGQDQIEAIPSTRMHDSSNCAASTSPTSRCGWTGTVFNVFRGHVEQCEHPDATLDA